MLCPPFLGNSSQTEQAPAGERPRPLQHSHHTGQQSHSCRSGLGQPLGSSSHLQSVLIDTWQNSLIEQAYRVHSTEKTMDAGILPMDTLSPDSSASGACLTSGTTNTIATGHTATRDRMAMLGFLKTLSDSPQRLGLLCMPYNLE